jgi:hypothetical protein
MDKYEIYPLCDDYIFKTNSLQKNNVHYFNSITLTIGK